MSNPEIRAAVVAERRHQVALCSSLAEPQWDAAALCEGWRVREVLAHTTMPFRYSLPQVVVEMVKARGRVDRMAERRARIDAHQLSTARLLASLRTNIEPPCSPPGGGPLGALSHDVIHGLDVSTPLGLDSHASPERVSLVLGGLRPKNIAFFGVALQGVQLWATDIDWSYGVGEPVHGRAQDLLLLLCGRRVAAERLEGTAATRFTTAS